MDDFQKSSLWVQNHTDSIPSSLLLQLYGLYKQATFGSPKEKKPSLLDWTGRAKWEAWNQQQHLTTEQAKQAYVSLVATLLQENPTSLDHQEETTTFGKRMSTCPTLGIPDDQKTLFDWVQEGNATLQISKCQDIHARDDQGMTLLHWAADRNHVPEVEQLLKLGADVNAVNNDGETPLFLASAAENRRIVQILLEHGADPQIQTADGELPEL